MKNIVNFTEPNSRRVQKFIDDGGIVKVITPEETAKKIAKQGGKHLNWQFTQQDWNGGKYSESGKEHVGKYANVDTTVDDLREIYSK